MLWQEPRPRGLQCSEVLRVPPGQVPAQDPVQSGQSGPRPPIGAEEISAVLAVKHRRRLVSHDSAPAARHQLIEPPIMGDRPTYALGFARRIARQGRPGGVEQHRVAACNALHKRIPETRRMGKNGRSAPVGKVIPLDDPGCAAIKRGFVMRGQRLQTAREPLGQPHVILIRQGNPARIFGQAAQQ